MEVIRQIQSGQNTVLGSVSTPPIWDELLRVDLPTFECPNRSPGPAIPLSVLESPSARNDPEILVVPREKTPTGAAARGNP